MDIRQCQKCDDSDIEMDGNRVECCKCLYGREAYPKICPKLQGLSRRS